MKKLLMLSLLCVTVGAFANPRPVEIRTVVIEKYSSDDPTMAKKIHQCFPGLSNNADDIQKFRDCVGIGTKIRADMKSPKKVNSNFIYNTTIGLGYTKAK